MPFFRYHIAVFFAMFLVCQPDSVIAQCPNPEFYDLDLANPSNTPQWIRCEDNAAAPDSYLLEIVSPNNIQNYAVDWGDGSPIDSGNSLVAGLPISHTYTNLGTFTVTFTETDTISLCSTPLTGTFISDRKPGATALPPTMGTNGCAPHNLSFENQSTNVSNFTRFVWDWGDMTYDTVGPAPEPGTVGIPIVHTYQQGTSDCGMQVTLWAMSLCDTTFVTFGPYDMFDLDTALVNASTMSICAGDSVTFDDVSNYNCVTGARRIRWDFTDFGGPNTGWLPAVPANQSQTYYVDGPIGSNFQIVLEDSNFCGIDLATVNVNIVAPPTAGINPLVDTICNNSNANFDNLSVGGTQYHWDYGDGSGIQTVGTTASQSHFYNISGDYLIQLVADIAGAQLCSDTVTSSLHVLANPIANFNQSASATCDSATVTFSDVSTGAMEWQWDFGGGDTAMSPGPHIRSFDSTGFYQISLTVREFVFNCSSTHTDFVAVYATPIPAILADTVCLGDSTSFLDASTIPDPVGQILREKWNGITGNDVIDLTSNPAYPNSPSETSVLTSFEAPQNDGSNFGSRVHGYIHPPETGLYRFWIASNNKSELYLSTDDNPANVALVATVPDFTNFEEWNKYGSQQSTLIQLDSTKRYYITAIYKEQGGADHLSVGWELPSATQERPIPGNRLSPYHDGKFITSWTWDFGDGSGTSTSQNPRYQYPNDTTYYVTLDVTTSQCSASDSFLVRVEPPIIADFLISDTTGCDPLLVEYVNTSQGAEDFFWSYGDGNYDTTSLADNDTINHLYVSGLAVDQTFNFQLTVTNSVGCINIKDTSLIVHPRPDANFSLTHPNPACAPLDITFTNLSQSEDTIYRWYVGTDTLLDADSIFSYSFNNAGPLILFDTIRLEAESKGCIDTMERPIVVFPEPDFNMLVSADSGCHPFNVDFSVDNIGGLYLWDFGDGFFDNSAAPTHSYTNTSSADTSFNVTLYVTSVFACADTLQTTIAVSPTLDASFVASPTLQELPNSTVSVIDGSVGTNLQYTWDYDDSTIVNSSSPSPHMYDTSGIYNIKLVVENAYCRDSAFQTVTIHPPPPIAGFTGTDTGCVSLTVNFTNTSVFGETYVWDFGDGETSTDENPSHTFISPGVFDVTLFVYGPATSDTMTLNQAVLAYPAPVANFNTNPDPPTNIVSPATIFFNNLSINADNYLWDFGDSTSSVLKDPLHTFNNPGNYNISLIARKDSVCADTFSISDHVQLIQGGSVVIPTAFTPNMGGPLGGDITNGGLNDIFYPKINGNIVTFKMSIFNRWGELLFHTTDRNIGWDGYYREKLAQEDNYVYKIEIAFEDGHSEVKLGDFYLMWQ